MFGARAGNSFNNNVDERRAIADVPALGEVGHEQCLDDCILATMLVGQPDEPVCVHGVWCSFALVECELDAFRFSDSNHLGIKLLRPFPTAKLFDAIFSAADTFFRHRGIELKWEPAHLNIVLSFKGSDGFFKPSFANVAPRADHVGDHINNKIHRNSSLIKSGRSRSTPP